MGNCGLLRMLDRSFPLTLVYDSEVARGLKWNPGLHNRTSIVALLKDLYVEACDSRVISWAHVRNQSR